MRCVIVNISVAEVDSKSVANFATNNRSWYARVGTDIAIARQGHAPTGGKSSVTNCPEAGLIRRERITRHTIYTCRHDIVEK